MFIKYARLTFLIQYAALRIPKIFVFIVCLHLTGAVFSHSLLIVSAGLVFETGVFGCEPSVVMRARFLPSSASLNHDLFREIFFMFYSCY